MSGYTCNGGIGGPPGKSVFHSVAPFCSEAPKFGRWPRIMNEVQNHEEKEEKVEVSGLPWKVHEELAWRIPSFRSPEKIQNMGEQRSHG